ncbi:MAG: replication-associated recombination protein A [Endomicrobia bacterium]|nr:replication-associated recombination protein A [Endomicrobiia bacterium]
MIGPNSLFNSIYNTYSLPLSVRFLPENFDEFLGQEHILGKNTVLRSLIEENKLVSLILYGPSGCGKTALTKLIVKENRNYEVLETNATLIGISDIKDIMKKFVYVPNNKKLLLIIDEIHHFNKYQQDILLPEVEKGSIVLISLTTENPYYYINSALLSRSFVAEFKKLKTEDIESLIKKVLKDTKKGLGTYNLDITEEAINFLAKYSDGDARRTLNILEIVSIYLSKINKNLITKELIEKCIPNVYLRYDKSSDFHYDHISALIKSIRGSDPDAALYWMTKMLMSGEDPRYIIRRLIILASEDVGNADPFALVLTTSALHASEFVGMPEMEIIMAQVVCYLACAEKSNACYEALSRVKKDIKNGVLLEVPNHLKDAHKDADAFKHGEGYLYPHDYEGAFVIQKYIDLDKHFYFPKDVGKEKEIKIRLEKWRQLIQEKKKRI